MNDGINKDRPSLRRPINGGFVSQWFGANPALYARFRLPGHNGIDYSTVVNTPVLATHDGFLEVPPQDFNGYGVYCIVRSNSFYTLYAHLDRVALPTVEYVHAGELIAYSGNTGNSTGPHLHLGLRLQRISWQMQPYRGWVDPWAFRE